VHRERARDRDDGRSAREHDSVNAVSSAQGATNTTPATATLTVLAPGVTLSKAFAPSTIAPSGISRLTISVANTASGAIALTAMSLTDTLPSGVTIATARPLRRRAEAER